jgi:hypothetical protein
VVYLNWYEDAVGLSIGTTKKFSGSLPAGLIRTIPGSRVFLPIGRRDFDFLFDFAIGHSMYLVKHIGFKSLSEENILNAEKPQKHHLILTIRNFL